MGRFMFMDRQGAVEEREGGGEESSRLKAEMLAGKSRSLASLGMTIFLGRK
jgi:hypothetical protein